jgi:hypothetical protein
MLPYKPPALHWLGQFFVPLGIELGSIEQGLLCGILFCQAVTLLMIFRIANELNPSRGLLTGIVGCTFVAAAPLFAGLTHQYLTEPLQTLAVTWFYYCAIFSRRWGRIRILYHMVAATSLAMLVKTTTPIYCLFPGLMTAIQFFRPRIDITDRQGIIPSISRLALLALTLRILYRAVRWYHSHWESVTGHAWQSSFGAVALYYGHEGEFLDKFIFWFTKIQEHLFTVPLFWIWAYVVMVGIASWANRLRRATTIGVPSANNALALGAGLHILGVMCIFSLNINEDWRFLMPLLPATSISLIWAVSQIQSRAIGLVLIVAALFQWGYVHSRTLDAYPWKEPYSWLEPPERSGERYRDIEAAVHLIVESAPFKTHAVGVDFSWCSPNTLSFYSAKEMVLSGKRAYFVPPGYAETDVEKALGAMMRERIDYFVSVEPEAHPQYVDFVNQVAVPVLDRVQKDTAHYRQVAFPSTTHLLLFRRIAPWPDEAKAVRAGNE